jgi:transcriptional regulator with XRE-family HTH domain
LPLDLPQSNSADCLGFSILKLKNQALVRCHILKRTQNSAINFARHIRAHTHPKHCWKILWTFFGHKIFNPKFGHYLTKMTTIKKTKSFGEHLRNLREDAGLTLKYVSEQIGIDTSLLAKIERQERQPTKHIIKQVAELFKVDEKELQNNFLSDQIANKILYEQADISILKVAEEKVIYLKTVHHGK